MEEYVSLLDHFVYQHSHTTYTHKTLGQKKLYISN